MGLQDLNAAGLQEVGWGLPGFEWSGTELLAGILLQGLSKAAKDW